jgi:predicted PurR-regulated permease PerM
MCSTVSDQVASNQSFVQRVFIAAAITLLVLAFAYLLWKVSGVLLLVFAGILVAVVLDGLTELTDRHTPLGRGWSLLVVLVVLVLALGVIGAWLGPFIADQITELFQRLPKAVDIIRSKLETNEWGRVLLRNMPDPSQFLSGAGQLLGPLAGAFTTALGVIGNVVVILIVGIFIAVDPDLYITGALHLIPSNRRTRAREVVHMLGHALQRWFMGRLASMAVIGILTCIGLSVAGIALPVALGFLAGILSFIPYIGPILALIPMLLVASLQSPTLALYALAVYGVVQFAESNLISPLIQKRMVSIPPALLITAQMLGGVVAGALGILLAEPAAVIALVIVQMLYIQDVLGESVPLAGDTSPQSSVSTPSKP